MHERANYQSLLDGKAMDPCNQLREVFCSHSSKSTLSFIKLYCDSPHVHLSQAYKHPVSGLLVTCGITHPQQAKVKLSRASEYVNMMEELELKIVKPLTFRVEGVVVFDKQITLSISSEDFFNKKAL